jgi:hypothetical protein
MHFSVQIWNSLPSLASILVTTPIDYENRKLDWVTSERGTTAARKQRKIRIRTKLLRSRTRTGKAKWWECKISVRIRASFLARKPECANEPGALISDDVPAQLV